MSDTKVTDRVVWLDVARGIAMLLVILGHAVRQEMRADSRASLILFETIYIFHMKLFFFLSGYAYGLSKKKHGLTDTKTFIVKKIKTLLIPWFVYSMLIYLVFYVLSFIPSISGMLKGTSYGYVPFLEYLNDIFIKGDSPYAYHMWFIYTLFFISIIVFLIEKYTGDSKKTVYILLALSLIGLILRFFVLKDATRMVHNITYYLAWFYAGELYNDVKMDRYKRFFNVFAVASFVILFVVYNFNRELVDNSTRGMTVKFLSVIFIYGVVIGWVNLAKFIARVPNLVMSFLNMVGKNTMAIYLFHQQFCCAIIGLILYNKLHYPIPIVIAVCVVASIVVPLAFVYILKKLGLGKVLNTLFAIR